MMAPTTFLVAHLAEKERIRCLKGSKVKLYGNDVVGSYKILLASFMFPLTAIIHSVGLHFLLKKYTKISYKDNIKICLLLFCL